MGCDLLFRYFDEGDTGCRIREVGIHLDTLQTYREIESDGVLVLKRGYASDPKTRRAIRLPRGKGVAGSPLIGIDGPATLDKETNLPELATGVPSPAANVGDPPCVGAGTCRITRSWGVPRQPRMRIVATVSTVGPFQPDGNGDECVARSYWLVRGAPAVLLAKDCEIQTGAATTGTASVEIRDGNLFFKYVEVKWDDECVVRDVGIHLDMLHVFREAERAGKIRKDDCKSQTPRWRTIPLQRGKGDAGSPLIELDTRTVRP